MLFISYGFQSGSGFWLKYWTDSIDSGANSTVSNSTGLDPLIGIGVYTAFGVVQCNKKISQKLLILFFHRIH